MKQQRRDRVIKIIEQLSDGQFHSGEAIGTLLGVTRTSVSQYIRELQSLGLDVFRVTGKGYRLREPLQLMSVERIKTAYGLASYTDNSAAIELERVVTSTNDVLKERLQNQQQLPNGLSVLAECQTEGRGRRGKRWLSPFGSNLYISLYWRLEQGMTAAMGLSLALGTAVAQVLAEIGINDVELKWPNDILVGGKKIAGILVELEGQALGVAHVIIGIGVNLAMPNQVSQEIDQPWTDIRNEIGDSFDRNKLAAQLIAKCRQYLDEYETAGLRHFMERWERFDRLKGKPVKIIMSHKEVFGIAEGIDDTGAILVNQNGVTEKFHAGEVSLRHDA